MVTSLWGSQKRAGASEVNSMGLTKPNIAQRSGTRSLFTIKKQRRPCMDIFYLFL